MGRGGGGRLVGKSVSIAGEAVAAALLQNLGSR